MAMTSTVKLEIDEKARNYAKIYASLIDNEFQRKRAYASITALYAFSNLIAKTNYSVQKAMTIFRNPDLNEKYEISDIYVNDWHIDIRIITDGDAFIVPRIHEEYSIEPDFYAVIKLDSSLQSAELAGFIKPDEMKKEPLDYHYYSVLTNDLFDYDKFLDLVKDKKTLNLNDEEHKFFLSNYLSLIDKEADEISTKRILKHLFQCPECRAEFCCFTGFEMVNCNLGKYPEILDDQTLNIIGAQAVEEKQYEGSEETVYFDDKHDNTKDEPQENELPAENEKEDFIEIFDNDSDAEINNEVSDEAEDSTVSDILDELFNIEEETIPLNDNIELPQEPDNQDLKLLPEDTVEAEEITEPDFIEINDDSDKHLELISDDEELTEELQELTEETDLIDIQDDEDISLIDIDDSEPELDIIEETNDAAESKESVDKVIVDYDENGEPIYSYITNINSDIEIEGKSEIESDIEPIEDDDNEQMSMLDIIDDDEDLENTDDIQEDLTEFEEKQSINDDLDTISDNEIDDKTENNYISDDEEFQEYDNEQEYEISENENIDEFNEDINEISDEKDIENDENISDDKEGEEETSEEFDTENNEKDEKDDYEDDYEEDDDEFEEYNDDDDIDIEENTGKKSSKNALIIAGAVTLAVAALAVTTFGLINKATDDTKIADNKQETIVPNVTETEEIFKDINEDDIFGELGVDNTDDNTASEVPDTGAGIDIPNQAPEPDNITDNADNKSAAVSEAPAATDDNDGTKNLTESDLLTPKPSNDLNKVMAGAFSDQSKLVTSIQGINWQCMPALFSNQEFKTYLQKLDKALKVNVNSNLLNSTTVPVNNTIAYKLAVDNGGNLLKIQASGSTGSEEIDNIVLQSIKETLALQKTQIISNGEQKADKYLLQVVIKL